MATSKLKRSRGARLGQHFLMHPRIAERMVMVAGVEKGDVVLEIGPGKGMLTKALLERAGKVVAVETDAALFEGLRERFAKEIADKLVNLFFAIFEILFLIWLFKLDVVPPQNLLLFLPIFINSVLISYFINLSLSFVGFWTTEVWPIRFIFIVLLYFVAGSYFPLDILPPAIYKMILLTPFPYIFYLPAKILTSHSATQPFSNVLLSYFWLLASYLFARLVWKSGIKSFSFWGR